MLFARAKLGVSVALLATLLLRAAVPDGYMPSAAGSGLLFELCPSGVPAAFMAALSGSSEHKHHDDASSPAGHFDAGQCPIGHLLSAAATLDTHWVQPEVPAQTPPPGLPSALRLVTRSSAHRSRGPPA
jgi:hypothetical protein